VVIALSKEAAISVLPSRFGSEKSSWIVGAGKLNSVDGVSESAELDLRTSRISVDCHSSRALKKFFLVSGGKKARYL
jgi:hypothetical protein